MPSLIETAAKAPHAIDVSIVIPCLDEALCLPACLANARAALEKMRLELGFGGEIIVADNGSSDGSQLIARACGARVVDVPCRGYGAALIGGFEAANGRYLVMGDADGSYDFCEATAMVARLAQGADLCMGSRFKGGIEPGAMPWKNRYIGNPALTFILNLFFGLRIDDAHCGLRALTKRCFKQLGLVGDGMEFASEMVIKAALKNQTIVEEPAALSRDLRNRPPHLRPWRDGWRHLRYLLMLSPGWVFAGPAAVLAALSLAIWTRAGIASFGGVWESSAFGNYWVVLAGAMLGLAHISGLLGASTYLYGLRQGYRQRPVQIDRLSRWVSLETMLVSGAGLFVLGAAVLLAIAGYWSNHQFERIQSVLPAVIGTTLTVIGAQNVLGGFLLAVLNGNEADFLKPRVAADKARAPRIEAEPRSFAS